MKWNFKEARKIMLGTDPKMAVLRLIAWREALDMNPTQLAGEMKRRNKGLEEWSKQNNQVREFR